MFILSLAVADLCFSVTYFPVFFTCEFFLVCDRQLRKIFAAYFAYSSFANLCVLTADRYVAIVMPFKYVSFVTSRCVVTMVTLSSRGLLLSRGDNIKTDGFRRRHDNFQNTNRICVSTHTLLFAATCDNTDVLHRAQALEKDDKPCFTVKI